MHRQAERSRVHGSLLHYDNGVKKEKWTRNELLTVAGCVFGLFCIWAFFQVRGCASDDTRMELSALRRQVGDLQKKNTALTEQLTDTRKQLQEATDRVFELTAVAGRAPAMPIKVKSWRDSSSTRSVALENESDQDLSVHVAVTSPNRERPREQDCFVPAHKTVGTPFRIYPRDVVIVTADGFARKTQRME